MKRILRRMLAAPLAVGGGALCYFGGWITCVEILPQILARGGSLRGTHLILSRVWESNQLYLLVVAYWLGGMELLFASIRLWSSRRARASGA